MKKRTIGAGAGSREVTVLGLGAMPFGSSVDEETSFAVLDRYVAAGGTFIDTANNYAFWHDRSQGGQSEALLGRWRASRGIGDEVVIATKVGGRPNASGLSFADTGKFENIEGLSAKSIRAAADRSRAALGVERLDLLYAHVEDPGTPVEETVGAFGELVAEGAVGLLGVCNHWLWRVERARSAAASAGVAGYEVLQYQHSYLRARTDLPGRRSPRGGQGFASGELLTYVEENPGVSLVAYSPLLSGAYVRDDRPFEDEYDHPGTAVRLAALRRVADETGATLNQVVLAWLIGHGVTPLVGASSVAQIEDSLGAVDLELSAEQVAVLDEAR
ncbi:MULTISPECIES: aldo/keto reductase [Actinosynnema]|uniref:aldo/keto reductase n=1 Tax=Actinosynnema TaxID=40566 RepID=UPI0020A47F53|nr:aldo/keto reductase [Actinosynnema pretiosum]MCP2098636.1 putative oxidoreductase [Actinosynnema pretiosum]